MDLYCGIGDQFLHGVTIFWGTRLDGFPIISFKRIAEDRGDERFPAVSVDASYEIVHVILQTLKSL